MDHVSIRLLVFAILLSASCLSAFRTNLIHHIDSGKPPSNVSLHYIRGDVVPGDWGRSVFVNISVGNPPIPQLLVMDTGSSQTWIQCAGCNPCFKQGVPLFNPAGSTTYKRVSCNSVYCSEGCDDDKEECPYQVQYADGSGTQGTLGTEEFTFSTSDDGQTSFGGIVFGCSYQIAGFGFEGGTGLLGLGWSWEGLAPQLEADRFSYCIGDLSDKDYTFSHLIVGRGSRLEGSSTPLKVYGDHYYVTLEGISVGGSRFDIHESEGLSRDVMVDSGTTLSYLPSPASDAVWSEVKKFVGSRLSRIIFDGRDDKLCYRGVSRKDMVGLPVVRLHLADGVDLVLDIESLFEINSRSVVFGGENSFCLTIAPVRKENRIPPIIGLTAQQFYNVGYNLRSRRIYFQRIGCQYLDDQMIR